MARKSSALSGPHILIGPDQRIVKIFPKVTPEGHAEEVLAAIKEHKAAAK